MIEPIIALVALSLMEVVLGIDNIVFISILTSKLPVHQQSLGRKLGLLLALGSRLVLLSCIFWIVQLKDPITKLSDWLPVEALKVYFTVDEGNSGLHGSALTGFGGEESDSREHAKEPEIDEESWEEFNSLSVRDLIMLAGGLFLIYSSVHEIHTEVEGDDDEEGGSPKIVPSFRGVLIKITIMDIVFSLDSVMTAVGMASRLWVMFAAVILAVAVMILFADQVGDFVERNPTIRMLALSFLLLIGIMLVAEGIGTPISKGYIYFAMAFSLFVESFNLKVRGKADAKKLQPQE